MVNKFISYKIFVLTLKYPKQGSAPPPTNSNISYRGGGFVMRTIQSIGGGEATNDSTIMLLSDLCQVSH